MKVGVNLINFGPGATPERLRRWVEVAEGLGYHLLMTSDHVAITADVQSRYPAPFYEPFTTLGWLAGVTRRIEIGATVIIVPYRHPLDTARALACVDQLSGGRLIVGVGVGWAKQEYRGPGGDAAARERLAHAGDPRRAGPGPPARNAALNRWRGRLQGPARRGEVGGDSASGAPARDATRESR
ncbi:MAG: LLM class flavin-dependent oxidoreductase [candidate division NC10 bacterium]